MMTPIALLIMTFIAGLLSKRLGYPPLLGYLASGFIAHEFEFTEFSSIGKLSDFGVTLLLFTIGLKIQIKYVFSPRVLLAASTNMVIVIPLTALMLFITGMIVSNISLPQGEHVWALAFALSFSSTVFAVKLFEQKGESSSHHASISIGILVFQDLIAVLYLAFSADKQPNEAALLLLLLPFTRPFLFKIMNMTGHGELMVLFGICIALGVSELFSLMSLKPDLGALAAGVLLSGATKTNELYKSLLTFKDIFLVGFFLQIGLYGIPSAEMLWIVLALNILIFLRPAIYFLLLRSLKISIRTSWLVAIGLFSYSEFGLIVISLLVKDGRLDHEWLTTLALSLTLSFFIASIFNRKAHNLYGTYLTKIKHSDTIEKNNTKYKRLLENTNTVVLGMGRIGLGAYLYLSEKDPGAISGIEENEKKAKELKQKNIFCIQGDATDYDFIENLKFTKIQKILICLSNHQECLTVVNLLKEVDFRGEISVVARHPDEELQLKEKGCIVFNLYAEAGFGFADHVLKNTRT